MERENLKSRLGFILLSAGCAIGIEHQKYIIAGNRKIRM